MKKYKVVSITLVAVFLIYVAVNLVAFLTTRKANIESPTFWVTWGFAFIGSFLIFVGATLYTTKVKKYEAILIPPAILLCGVFSVLYIISGFVFINGENVNYLVPLIAYIIATIIYLIILAYFLFTASYISDNKARQTKKVFFIRDLVNDVNYLQSTLTDSELVKALKALEEQIRFSDPMSHDSLEVLEYEIKDLIQSLVPLTNEDKEQALKIIKDVSSKVDYRNAKCRSLK